MPVVNGTNGAGAGTSARGALSNPRFTGDSALEAVLQNSASIMRAGATGAGVGKVQQALLDMGFALKPYAGSSGRLVGGVDEQFGQQTTRALTNFQQFASRFFANVRATGALDQATLRALDALAPPPGKTAWAQGVATKLPNPYWRGDKNKPLRVVVVQKEHRSYLFDKAGKISGIFSNSIGAPGTNTETGFKVIVGKLDEAAAKATGERLWDDPKAFGVRILNLSWAEPRRASGEELHGTYRADQMGLDVSHGCMRHYNEDIITMYEQLKVGDYVAVVDSIDDRRLGGVAPGELVA